MMSEYTFDFDSHGELIHENNWEDHPCDETKYVNRMYVGGEEFVSDGNGTWTANKKDEKVDRINSVNTRSDMAYLVNERETLLLEITSLNKRVEALKKHIFTLEEIISNDEKIIASKDEIIRLKDEVITSQKAALDLVRKVNDEWRTQVAEAETILEPISKT